MEIIKSNEDTQEYIRYKDTHSGVMLCSVVQPRVNLCAKHNKVITAFKKIYVFHLFKPSMAVSMALEQLFNAFRLRQNNHHFPNNIFKHIFFNENFWILSKISLKYFPYGVIDNIETLVEIMAYH